MLGSIVKSLLAPAVVLGLVQPGAPGPAADGPGPTPVAASVRVGDTEVGIVTTDVLGELLVTIAGEGEPARIQLPGPAGRITELRACPWTDSGVALAVEAESGAGGRRYSWSTFKLAAPSQPIRRLDMLVVDEFLVTDDDHDLTGIVNSSGDSIYIVVSRHTRHEAGEDVTGYVLVNNCPVAPDTARLYTLRSERTGEVR